ncbi:MAG: DNA/RNA non-specific endonuclease [Prevotella sp.]|nr:DNA/RNA non-specific endonuclease [Prevotella sp.]
MKKLINYIRFIPLALAATLMLAACGDDDDNGTSSGSASTSATNVNANTKSTPDSIKDVVKRIEVPHLASGQMLVLVNKTDEYGVNYIVEWDCNKKAQRWSCWEWDASNSVSNWNRNNWSGATWQGQTWTGDPFQEDARIPEQYQSKLSDYSGSGYNRGHICASADRLCSQDVNGQTFYLSNMQPQVYGFNAGVWENMESQVRKWNTSSMRDTLWVCKGGTIGDVYLDGEEQTGIIEQVKTPLIVPKYFFMALVAKKNGAYKGIAFWAEHKVNDDAALAKYVITIDELEERTGIDFFCNLPDNIEESVESVSSLSTWGLQ